ncbi:MAG: SAM-dependent methyltransferase [Rhodobacterales bacterium CG18_big_fil_WC_8_21_14_2_50_71_9]|nr:MAG: SAM-dependent methyltransferase [Rhodobacterales bacterium CG18_big_fil_WC_8_21_14_2_50_71_9]PJA59086.1 MAG: SAM-dependent methyltransferase [Rhodobacterales bacterium CG_4_9_14_3_um_filter_71_31]
MSLISMDGAPRWFHTVFSIVGAIHTGALTFVMPDGREYRAQGENPGPEGVVVVRDPRLFWRMIRDGELGFAEAYMDGWWDTPDLQAVLDAALINNDTVARGFGGRTLTRLVERLRHLMNRNTRRGSARNISRHYDLGNDFYAKWLDESMTYSSALFQRPDESLPQAQRNKYAAICDRMGARPGDHLLEIGCGWGGFAEYAAGERGARVTGLTISREQHDFARRRVFEAGLAERVEIVMRDYRDERGNYDGVASIEMFEAVGEKYWPVYFDTVRERLKPGSQATLQIITIADKWFDGYREGADFIQKYIFPGGFLPCPSALKAQTGRAGLEWVESHEFGQSYSDTLRRWRTKFNGAWAEIAPMGFDERFKRMWNFYLAVCASCFLAETTDVTQVTLRRASA